MAIYEEKLPTGWKTLLFLALSFLALYSPWQLGDRELYWDEGIYASMALEMEHFPPLTIAHGELIPNSFPLYPCFVWCLNQINVSMELSLRIVPVICMAILSVLVWEAGRRAGGLQAAAVGVAVLISSLVVVEKTVDGYPDVMGILFIFSGWLAWFTFGIDRGKWDLAWIFSFFFCGLAFYTFGWIAILYFIFPLLFMRRPLTLWPKLRRHSFFIGLFILIAFILLWSVPRWFAVKKFFHFRPTMPWDYDLPEYLEHLMEFPFEIVLRFLPWALLAWAPFCVAFHPLDKNPIFSRFLRTIFISLFFLMWFSPFSETRHMIILGPPLAIMTGLNYWLLVRRYGHQLHRIFHYCSYILLALSIAGFIYYMIPHEWWQRFYTSTRIKSTISEYRTVGKIYILLAFSVATYTIYGVRKKSLKVFEHVLLLSVSLLLLYWAVIYPYKVQNKYQKDAKSIFGMSLQKSIAPIDFTQYMTVYKENTIYGLYNECFYLGCKVKTIHSLDELPLDRQNVFLLCTKIPPYPQRKWQTLYSVEYKKKNLYLLKGIKVKRSGMAD